MLQKSGGACPIFLEDVVVDARQDEDVVMDVSQDEDVGNVPQEDEPPKLTLDPSSSSSEEEDDDVILDKNVGHCHHYGGRSTALLTQWQELWVLHVGQTICLYIPVASDSSIFHYYVYRSPTSIIFG